MKALLCRAWGEPETLVLEDVPTPTPGKGQLVVSVRACGVNFPDALIVQGKYQVKPEFPFSPGAECAGVVKEVGEGVNAFKPGDAVIAFPGHGGYAEEVRVDADKVVPMPPGLEVKVAGSFVITYATTHHALKDVARLRQGETMLVLGAAGGTGLSAVELGSLAGAQVIAAASSEDKLATCKRAGAAHLINYEKGDLREALRAITGAKGVDVVYDPVGGRHAETALRNTGWQGRYLVIGFAAGDIPRVPLNLALLMERKILGVYWGEWSRRNPEANRANVMELAGWMLSGRLKPYISATYPLERAAQALRDLIERRVQGKAVILTGL
jgi:NADPH2:quinone reductase